MNTLTEKQKIERSMGLRQKRKVIAEFDIGKSESVVDKDINENKKQRKERISEGNRQEDVVDREKFFPREEEDVEKVLLMTKGQRVIVGSQSLTMDQVFQTQQQAVAVASQYYMSGSYDCGVDLEKFVNSSLYFMGIDGKNVDISVEVVRSALSYIILSEQQEDAFLLAVNVKTAMREKTPKKINATLGVCGQGVVVFDAGLNVGNSIRDEGLALKFDEHLRLPITLHEKPAKEKAMIDAMADAYKVHPDDVRDQEMMGPNVLKYELPIPTTFPTMSKMYGTMSDLKVSTSINGAYSLAANALDALCGCDVLFVRDYNVAQHFDVAIARDDFNMRVVPFPSEEYVNLAGLSLYSTVADYAEGFDKLFEAELIMKNASAEERRDKTSRGILHEEKKDVYDTMRRQPHGYTVTGKKYVTLASPKRFTSAQLIDSRYDGSLDNLVCLVRLNDYYTACSQGFKGGSITILDPPTMLALYISPGVYETVSPEFKTKWGVASLKGVCYTPPPMPTTREKILSDAIFYYVLAFYIKTLVGEEVADKFLDKVKAKTVSNGRTSNLVRHIDKLHTIFGDVRVCMNVVVYRAPAYSARKMVKLSLYDPGEDDFFDDESGAVEVNGFVEPPDPESDDDDGLDIVVMSKHRTPPPDSLS